MTVRQLMMQLSAMPPDAPVYVMDPEGGRDYDIEITLTIANEVKIW